MTRLRIGGKLVTVALALSVLATQAAQALRAANALAESDAPPEISEACPPNLWAEGLHDYRNRDASDWDRWKYKDMWGAHVGRALIRMDAGEYSRRVRSDLHYALARWPNHIPAMQALVKYDLAGGQRYEFPKTQCYFVSARAFAPDDVAVRLAEGYFHWKMGDLSRAKSVYEEALRLDSASADAHYNLGLVLFELKDYSGARDHAHAAYAAGFPLPGLMTKLKQVGFWDALPADRRSGDPP